MPTTAKKNTRKKVVKKVAVVESAETTVPKITRTKKEKTAAVKEAVTRATTTPRERYLEQLCLKNTLTIPPIEEMFSRQIAEGLQPLPLSKLAAFCSNSGWIATKGALGKCLDEVTNYFGDINYLNKSAEIDPKRVETVIISLLETGSLTHEPKVAHVTNTPSNLTYEEDVFQVWDGRHRVVAMAVIYGIDAVIYAKVNNIGYARALLDCVISNDTRQIKKLESIHHQGLKDGDDPVVAYVRKKGKMLNIVKWVVSQVRPDMVPNPSLNPVNRINIVEKVKGAPGMTSINFQNTIINALTQLGARYSQDRFDKRTKDLFNDVTATIEAVYMAISAHSDNTKTSLAWNSYSSPVIGNIIGRAIDYWRVNKITMSTQVVEDFANQLAAAVCNYMDTVPATYAQNPSGTLKPQLLMFADTQLGIIFPHVEEEGADEDIVVTPMSTPEEPTAVTETFTY
jgi:hypothetical protein